MLCSRLPACSFIRWLRTLGQGEYTKALKAQGVVHNNPIYRRSSVSQKRRRGSQRPPLGGATVTDPTPPIEVEYDSEAEDDDDHHLEEVQQVDDGPVPVKLVRQHSLQ